MVEIEAKMRVESHEAVRRALRERGAAHRSAVLETNRLFDRADGSLYRGGCGLRVRESRDEVGRCVRALVTYKGPLRIGPYKTREEIEFGVEDAARAVALLHALGFSQVLLFEKRRETWRLGEAEVVLDELPRLGPFVEVEAASESQVRAALEQLGLADRPHIRDSYVTLLIDEARRAGMATAEFRFGDAGSRTPR